MGTASAVVVTILSPSIQEPKFGLLNIWVEAMQKVIRGQRRCRGETRSRAGDTRAKRSVTFHFGGLSMILRTNLLLLPRSNLLRVHES
jgi:hypothetical protein